VTLWKAGSVSVFQQKIT